MSAEDENGGDVPMKVYRVDFETITKNSVLVEAPTDWEAKDMVLKGEVWDSDRYEVEETDEDTIESSMDAVEVVQKTGLKIKLNTEIDQDTIEEIREAIEDRFGFQILSIDEFTHTEEDDDG